MGQQLREAAITIPGLKATTKTIVNIHVLVLVIRLFVSFLLYFLCVVFFFFDQRFCEWFVLWFRSALLYRFYGLLFFIVLLFAFYVYLDVLSVACYINLQNM